MMMKTTILLFCLGLCAAAPADERIVGGEETTIEEYPYQLQLEAKSLLSWGFSCGGVIIGSDLALCAGHCLSGRQAKNLRFRSGSTKHGAGTIHTIEVAILHPDYHENQGTAVNDVAFFKVTPAFDLDSDSAKAIGITSEEPAAGDLAVISGWGLTSENGINLPSNLRVVEIPIVSRDECTDAYGKDLIGDSMICAGVPQGGKDSCSGDSGGPLVVNDTLAGLVSWGYGCAEEGYPGVYTNLDMFRDWINKQVEENS